MLSWFSTSAFVFAAMAMAFSAHGAVVPIPDSVKPAVEDKLQLIQPDRIHLDGFLGTRISRSEAQRLLMVDEEELLDGFRHRPGKQFWIGEHVGKFLHAGTLAWVYSGDSRLKVKIDRVASELIKCQEPDGYLGTYVNRWPKRHGWDVWVHKYCMIGLLTHYKYTGDTKSLEAAKRIGDLLCNTFGQDKKNITAVGEHMGMAESSVLEPMVLLYRQTGDPRYLNFCKYILWQWDQPGGPHVVSSLLQGKPVNQVATAKAYEMLSCINGALELYRTTGDEKLLTAAENAWNDITAKRLQITGSGSQHEHWQADYELPVSEAKSSETCVTVTWMQVNLQLLRLTGDGKYANELEKSVYNHLLAAQNPRGDDWCYYTELAGRKQYDKQTTCCHSSGPRGVALIPMFACMRDGEGAVVNFYESGQADMGSMKIEQQTKFPDDGKVDLMIHPAAGAGERTIKLRVPVWSSAPLVKVNDSPVNAQLAKGYIVLRHAWKDGDRIQIDLHVGPRVVMGEHGNGGKAAFAWGPFILAADQSMNRELSLFDVQVPGVATDLQPSALPDARKVWPGDRMYKLGNLNLIPFCEAGETGGNYMVWMPLAGKTLR